MAILVVSLLGVPVALATETGGPLATGTSVRSEPSSLLDAASATDSMLVLVTGVTTADAAAAVRLAGLSPVEVFERLAIVAATGSPAAVRAVHSAPDVVRVDANMSLEWMDEAAHRSTGVAQLRDTAGHPRLSALRRPGKAAFDGSGVSIAVIDGGFDAQHEAFVDGGASKFDVHLRQGCVMPRENVELATDDDPMPDCSAWMEALPGDDIHLGHGTAVASVAAGYSRATADGFGVSGTAPGARLVGLSIGLNAYYYNMVSALNWIADHHADPCGDGSCPPIKVVNNSWGANPSQDHDHGAFDPDSPVNRATTALIQEGVVVVFAAGNSGGDGTAAETNVFARNPRPGLVEVGSYEDGNVGDRTVGLARSSSRGARGDLSTYPDLVAPGVVLAACTPSPTCAGPGHRDGTYAHLSGTSLAAPYVSGLIAQLFQADPDLTPADIENVLEDTAFQGFIAADDLEPDGDGWGNDDHLTSFEAGHGLVDAVGALSRLRRHRSQSTPDPCPSREPEAMFADPAGDTSLMWDPVRESPIDLQTHDILDVTVSLDAEPGALSVTVRMAEVPAAAKTRMVAVVAAYLDGGYAEVDLTRDPTGSSFSTFAGDVRVEGRIDPDHDALSFVIWPASGPAPTRAGGFWVWTSAGTGQGDADITAVGTCSVYHP